jgi:hypothetical protein
MQPRPFVLLIATISVLCVGIAIHISLVVCLVHKVMLHVEAKEVGATFSQKMDRFLEDRPTIMQSTWQHPMFPLLKILTEVKVKNGD